MTIESSAQRAIKEAYSSNALRPAVYRTVDTVSKFDIDPRDNVTLYYGPAAGSQWYSDPDEIETNQAI